MLWPRLSLVSLVLSGLKASKPQCYVTISSFITLIQSSILYLCFSPSRKSVIYVQSSIFRCKLSVFDVSYFMNLIYCQNCMCLMSSKCMKPRAIPCLEGSYVENASQLTCLDLELTLCFRLGLQQSVIASASPRFVSTGFSFASASSNLSVSREKCLTYTTVDTLYRLQLVKVIHLGGDVREAVFRRPRQNCRGVTAG